MKNSVIFDLDGTLWEVIESTYISANKIAKKYNLTEISRDTICKVFGHNKEESAKLYFPTLELEKSEKLLDEMAVLNIEILKANGGNVYKDAKNVLNMLAKKYDLYIVSNTAEVEYIRAFLCSEHIEKLFKDYIAASFLNISKEDAIKKLINDNNIKNTVYVGDTDIDNMVAEKNNIPFIQAKYGFGEDLHTKYSINEMEELPDILKEIFND